MPRDWLALADPGDVYPVTELRPGPAQEVLYLEAVDWTPTASSLTMPTSCVAAGAYVFPTSYAAPTVYATAYLTDSAPVTPTTYLAPSYYYPTTFRSSAIVDAAVMPTLYARTTSTRCCGEVVDTPIVRDLLASSEPAEDDSIPSNVPELPTREADASQAGETTAPGRLRDSETSIKSRRIGSRPAPSQARAVNCPVNSFRTDRGQAGLTGAGRRRPGHRAGSRRGVQVDDPTWPARLRGPRTWCRGTETGRSHRE